MARPRGHKWMADIISATGVRLRKTFATQAEALAYERQPEGEPLRHTVSAMFPHGYQVLWQHTKNAKHQLGHVNNWITLLGPATLCKSITTSSIQDAVLKLRSDGNSDATINRKLVTLNQLLKHGIDRGVDMAMPRLKKGREGEGRVRWLSQQEYASLVAHMPAPYSHFADFLLYTGCRIGEALELRWQDIQNKVITLRWSTTKGARTRSLPLVGKAYSSVTFAKTLVDYGTEKVWAGIDYQKFHTAFTLAKVRARLPEPEEIVPHTLRHTCASWMAQDGVGIQVIQKWLGHATITITMRYAHLSQDALHGAGVVLEARSPDGVNQPSMVPNV